MSFVREVNRRFNKVLRSVRQAILVQDVFALRPRPRAFAELARRAYEFKTDAEKVGAFMEWLQEEIDAEILTVVNIPGGRPGISQHWTAMYIQRAYERGVDRARQEMKKAGLELADVPLGGFFNTPMHADRVALLFTRTFNDLKGITAAMSQQIARVLAEGMGLGLGPEQIARNIASSIESIGLNRARTLARTEIIRAHHVATIAEYEAAGVGSFTVKAEWSTAQDGRVCEICGPLQGKVYSLEEIKPLIPRHPNCRCCALPVFNMEDVQ